MNPGRRNTRWGVYVLVVGLTWAVMAVAQGKNVASEFLEVEIVEEMASANLLALLDQTVGEGASSGANPAIAHPLRRGVYVTAIPQGTYVILRFEVDGGARSRARPSPRWHSRRRSGTRSSRSRRLL